MTTFLKFVHIGGIGVWAGGLLVLPYLFWQRGFLPAAGYEVERLHRLTRFVYVGMSSPAAAVAIASGTALIFLRQTFEAWFTLKMMLVGTLVMLHVIAGLVVSGMFTPEARRLGPRANVLLTTGYCLLVTAILWVVLAKPPLDLDRLAPELFAPGALRHLLVGEADTPMP